VNLGKQQTQIAKLQFKRPDYLLLSPAVAKFSLVLCASFEVLWTCNKMIDVSVLPQEYLKVLKSFHFSLVDVDLFFRVALVALGTV